LGLAGEWREVRLGDLVDEGVLAISDGYRVRNEELGPEGIPFVRGGDIGDGWINTTTEDHIRPEFADRVRAKMTRPGDVAFITKGTVGRAGRLREGQPPVVFAPQVAYWRVLEPEVLDSAFLFYLVRSHAFQSALYGVKSHGAMVADYVSISQQHDFRLQVPDIGSQRAIARILGTLDDKIELNRRMNETLESIARALFQSWFVAFDPVRAKAEGRDPGLPKHIADQFPDSFEESELGEIPKGWAIKSVGDLADVVGGSTPSTKEPAYWDGGIHNWATPKDLSGLSVPVLLDTERRISDAGLAQISSGLLPVGTVLLSSRAPIGYLAVAEVPLAINQGFIAMKSKACVSNLFLLLWAHVAHEHILSRANGSTFLEISKSNFRPITVIAPPENMMNAFDTRARPLYKRIVECERESRTLTVLRGALLPKLISGELRIQVAETLVEHHEAMA
jgi:type I restriction enzyme S subunit